MHRRSLNIRVPRLGINRFGVFYVRSSETDESGRRRVTQRSLGTKDPFLAKILALRFCLSLVSEDLMSDLRKNNQNYELDLAKGLAKADGPEDHARMLEAMNALKAMGADGFLGSILRHSMPPAEPSIAQSAAPSPQDDISEAVALQLASIPKPLNAGKKLRQALDEHLEEEKRKLKSARTVQEKKALFDEFFAHHGDVYLNQITLDDISASWRSAEFSRENQKQKGERLSLGRLEKRRGYLAKFFAWAKTSGQYRHDNPMSQKMANKKEIRAATTPYKEFTGEDLKALFGPKYRIGMDKPDWYWIPLISLYSGARLSEIADLALNDFELIDGIHAFYIPDGKTKGSIRTVPVHSALIELGLIHYVDFLRSQGESHLFGLRPLSSRGKSAGRQWGLWVDRCGINDPSKVFHSFRSTAITDMYNTEAPNPAAIRTSVGHSDGTRGAHGGYIRGVALKRVRDTIESLQFPTISVDELKLEDPRFSSFFLAEKARLSSPEHLAAIERKKRRQQVRQERMARLEKSRKRAT